MLVQNNGKWNLITPKDLSNYEIDSNKSKYGLSREYAKNYDLCRIQVMIEQNKFDEEMGLYGACMGGHRDLAEFMIQIKANNWDIGLEGACEGGHRELAEWMIEKGAKCWNEGLYGACLGGYRELAELMIEKGANNWNFGLGGACKEGHRELIELMIEKGAICCYYNCYKSSEEHLKIID